MNGRGFIYGSLAAFAAAQASALAIHDVALRTLVQAGIGLAMFVAGVFVKPVELAATLTGRRKVEPPKKDEIGGP